MTTEVAPAQDAVEALNALIMNGDMSKLTPKQKLDYYHGICKSIGLNPLTNPFQYMVLNGKQVLYATKGAAEQIRNIRGISITKSTTEIVDDLVIVTVEGKDKDGRVDTDIGTASIANLRGDVKGNAILKAVTKAKRRLTLSMAGLGMLDETEVEAIPGAQMIALPDPVKELKLAIRDNPAMDLSGHAETLAIIQEQEPETYEKIMEYVNARR